MYVIYVITNIML